MTTMRGSLGLAPAPAPSSRGLSWSERWADAACAGHDDPDAWYAPGSETDRVAEAVAVCRRCPLQVECVEEARTSHARHGIWGGLTAEEINPTASAPVRGDAWEAWELEVAAEPITAAEVAERVGRTRDAVLAMRSRLRRRAAS